MFKSSYKHVDNVLSESSWCILANVGNLSFSRKENHFYYLNTTITHILQIVNYRATSKNNIDKIL